MKANRRPQYRVIALDETAYWDLEGIASPDDIANLERIETVYVYDATEHTYACEMMPSYWLIPVETREIFRDGYEPADDSLNATIMGYADYEGQYVHVAHLDALHAAYAIERPWPRAKALGSMGYRRAPELVDIAQALSENSTI